MSPTDERQILSGLWAEFSPTRDGGPCRGHPILCGFCQVKLLALLKIRTQTVSQAIEDKHVQTICLQSTNKAVCLNFSVFFAIWLVLMWQWQLEKQNVIPDKMVHCTHKCFGCHNHIHRHNQKIIDQKMQAFLLASIRQKSWLHCKHFSVVSKTRKITSASIVFKTHVLHLSCNSWPFLTFGSIVMVNVCVIFETQKNKRKCSVSLAARIFPTLTLLTALKKSCHCQKMTVHPIWSDAIDSCVHSNPLLLLCSLTVLLQRTFFQTETLMLKAHSLQCCLGNDHLLLKMPATIYKEHRTSSNWVWHCCTVNSEHTLAIFGHLAPTKVTKALVAKMLKNKLFCQTSMCVIEWHKMQFPIWICDTVLGIEEGNEFVLSSIFSQTKNGSFITNGNPMWDSPFDDLSVCFHGLFLQSFKLMCFCVNEVLP